MDGIATCENRLLLRPVLQSCPGTYADARSCTLLHTARFRASESTIPLYSGFPHGAWTRYGMNAHRRCTPLCAHVRLQHEPSPCIAVETHGRSPATLRNCVRLPGSVGGDLSAPAIRTGTTAVLSWPAHRRAFPAAYS